MPIDPKEVRVGHCYATSGGQLRKVTALVDGRVHHDALEGSGGAPPPASEAGAQTLEAFANAVEREIPCPEVPRTRPSKAEG